jgi:hypothetical protein
VDQLDPDGLIRTSFFRIGGASSNSVLLPKIKSRSVQWPTGRRFPSAPKATRRDSIAGIVLKSVAVVAQHVTDENNWLRSRFY